MGFTPSIKEFILPDNLATSIACTIESCTCGKIPRIYIQMIGSNDTNKKKQDHYFIECICGEASEIRTVWTFALLEWNTKMKDEKRDIEINGKPNNKGGRITKRKRNRTMK